MCQAAHKLGFEHDLQVVFHFIEPLIRFVDALADVLHALGQALFHFRHVLRQDDKQLFRFALIAPDFAQRRKKQLVIDPPSIGDFCVFGHVTKDAAIAAA